MSAEAGISTRLVKGSDLAQGKRVRVLAGTYAGTEATVLAIALAKGSTVIGTDIIQNAEKFYTYLKGTQA